MIAVILTAIILIYTFKLIDRKPISPAGMIGKFIWNTLICVVAIIPIMAVWLIYLIVQLTAA